MNEYKKILKFARPHQKYIYGSLFFNILYSVFQLASLGTILPVLGMLFGTIKPEKYETAPVYSGEFLDFFTYVKDYSNYYIQNLVGEYGALKVLAWLCIITAFMFLLRNMFRYFGAFLLINYRVGVTKDLRGAMYRKILSLPVSFFTESRKGDLMSRMSNDVGEVEGNILGSLVELINAPFMLISTLVSLFFLSAEMTLFSLLVLPVMGTMIALVGKSLKKDSHEAQNEMGTIFSIVDETLKSSKVIKIFNAEKIMDNRFMRSMNKWISSSISLGRKKELASPMSEFLGSITFLIIAWYGGKQIIVEQSISPADFLVFLGLFFQILPPAKSLSTSISNVQKGEASLKRVLEILDADVKIEEVAEPVSISTLQNNIEFKNIGFYYDKSNLILKNFNLTIPKGRTVALVGQSGSGKTTIANLLARFYDVSEGEILIDGTDIKHLKLQEYRQLLGMVTQESVLFNDSVYNNILMGKPDATRKEVIAAAKIANADDFITNLSEGYDTNIGDDGNKLSGKSFHRKSCPKEPSNHDS